MTLGAGGKVVIVMVPGLGGSGARHWQTLWQEKLSAVRVEQDNWDEPSYTGWVTRLQETVDACRHPVVLVAHSLGCALVAHWSGAHDTTKVVGALLVAPADVDSDVHTPPETRVFAPMPLTTLSYPTIVIASTDDPYVKVVRARAMANAWGGEFVLIRNVGHLNAKSKLGVWEQGLTYLEQLTVSGKR